MNTWAHAMAFTHANILNPSQYMYACAFTFTFTFAFTFTFTFSFTNLYLLLCIELNQSNNDVKFFHQLFDRGNMFPIDLFLDFQDWRMGSRGFNWYGNIPPSIPTELLNKTAVGTIRGSHFWPFDQKSLGPDIPCYLQERNQGLVLDRLLQAKQIDQQEALVDDIKGRIDWLGENVEWASMDAVRRSRKDVRSNLTLVQAKFFDWWVNEKQELKELDSSMCSNVHCTITFDTSTLKLWGAINDTGVIRKTSAGTEVAVFTFNSIHLGPEVKVVLQGQRAIALLSKTSAVINTTFRAHPGTIGGFQGGRSV